MNVTFETEMKADEKNRQEDKIDYYQSNAQEKFINLLYNDILKNFTTEYLF